MNNPIDISMEEWRHYLYPNVIVRVENPKTLFVTKVPGEGDRHRIISTDEAGNTLGNYITPGWYGITWKNRDQNIPTISF